MKRSSARRASSPMHSRARQKIDAWFEGRRLEGPLVTGNYFQVLGVNCRTWPHADAFGDQPGGPPAIVLSHRAWSLHFESDPGVLKRAVRVNGASYQVVGVMPEDFRGLAAVAAPDYWAPLSLARPLPADRRTGTQRTRRPQTSSDG